MGLETLAIAAAVASVGGGLMSASAAQKAGKAEIEALSRESELKANRLKQETLAKAASQKTRFLNSGFTLEGTPMDVLSSIFNTGIEDITQSNENYYNKMRSVASQARSKALSDIVSGVGSAAIFATTAGLGSAAPAATPPGGVIPTPVLRPTNIPARPVL